MIIGTAGHIDHGKTALVRALTGVDTDRLKEEKARGISIDLGFAYLPARDGSVLGFVDVPGHEKFVRNMLAGATGIDFVLLVVAADDGVMPQTLSILPSSISSASRQGIVALTKADLVSPGAATKWRRTFVHAWTGTRWRGPRSFRSRRSPAKASTRCASGCFRLRAAPVNAPRRAAFVSRSTAASRSPASAR